MKSSHLAKPVYIVKVKYNSTLTSEGHKYLSTCYGTTYSINKILLKNGQRTAHIYFLTKKTKQNPYLNLFFFFLRGGYGLATCH